MRDLDCRPRVSSAPCLLVHANDVLLASMRHLQGLPEQAFRTSIESIGLLEATPIPEDLQAPAKAACGGAGASRSGWRGGFRRAAS